MRLSQDAEFDERTSFELKESDVDELHPQLRLEINRDALEAAWAGASRMLALVIRGTDLLLRRSRILFECSLDGLPSTWEIPKTACDGLAWRAGVRITVALVLMADCEPDPGKPFYRGHWVARRDFELGVRKEQSSFPIEKWTPEDFVRQNLPADTSFWLQFNADNFNQRFEHSEEAMRLLLRSDVYDALVDEQDRPSGRAVMSVLLSEIVTDVLWTGLSNLDSTEELVTGGVLRALLDRITKATKATRQDLAALVLTGERGTMRAFVQATLGTRKEIARIKGEA